MHSMHRMRAIITRGLNIFTLFLFSREVCNQKRFMTARVQYVMTFIWRFPEDKWKSDDA